MGVDDIARRGRRAAHGSPEREQPPRKRRVVPRRRRRVARGCPAPGRRPAPRASGRCSKQVAVVAIQAAELLREPALAEHQHGRMPLGWILWRRHRRLRPRVAEARPEARASSSVGGDDNVKPAGTWLGRPSSTTATSRRRNASTEKRRAIVAMASGAVSIRSQRSIASSTSSGSWRSKKAAGDAVLERLQRAAGRRTPRPACRRRWPRPA